MPVNSDFFSGRERRRHQRTPLNTKIRISHESFGSVVVRTRDISESGVFVVSGDAEMPPPGAIVEGQIQDGIDDRPVVLMEVVRVESDGIGLRFLD